MEKILYLEREKLHREVRLRHSKSDSMVLLMGLRRSINKGIKFSCKLKLKDQYQKIEQGPPIFLSSTLDFRFDLVQLIY